MARKQHGCILKVMFGRKSPYGVGRSVGVTEVVKVLWGCVLTRVFVLYEY